MNDTTHERFRELLPSHALGALDDDDRERLEAHLAAGCGECERELGEWLELVCRLPEALEPVEPSAVTRSRLLAAVEADSAAATATPARRRSPAIWWLAAASIAALVLASWSAMRQTALIDELDRAAGERQRLVAEQVELRGQLLRARGQLAELATTVDLVSSPASRRFALAGLGPAAAASGTAVVDARRGSARFLARGLPPLAPGTAYQLWYITEERGAVSAGVFAVGPEGGAVVDIPEPPAPERVQLWAVTIEPEGGVPQPTGEMVLKS